MATDRDDSPESIVHDANAQREEVQDTFDELRGRFSINSLTESAADYLRGDGGQRLAAAVRVNPLAFIIAAAAIGWLLYTARQGADGLEPARTAAGLKASGDRKPNQDAEDHLADALEQTFPASDPVSISQIESPGGQAQPTLPSAPRPTPS